MATPVSERASDVCDLDGKSLVFVVFGIVSIRQSWFRTVRGLERSAIVAGIVCEIVVVLTSSATYLLTLSIPSCGHQVGGASCLCGFFNIHSVFGVV